MGNWRTQEGKNEVEHSGVIKKGRDSDFSLESLNSKSRGKIFFSVEKKMKKVRNLNSEKKKGRKT